MNDYSWIDANGPIPEFPDSFRFDRFTRKGKTFGRLAQDVQWQTEVIGHDFTFAGTVEADGIELWLAFRLYANGVLTAFGDCEWDYGTGAIDDLCVIYASLPHDIGCHLTNKGWIPWKWRKAFDRLYRKALKHYGCPSVRRLWQSAVIRANSKFVAYWKAEK